VADSPDDWETVDEPTTATSVATIPMAKFSYVRPEYRVAGAKRIAFRQ
jgi:hypothetical protein